MDAELQTGSESEPEGGSGAEQAFEALRVEVASMRRQLELVHRQGELARDASAVLAPDYPLTLGKMEKALGGNRGTAGGRRAPAGVEDDRDGLASGDQQRRAGGDQ